MLNLANVASAKLSEIRQFCIDNSIEVLGDRRLRQTWIDAAIAFLQSQADRGIEAVQEICTYDNAVIAANAINSASRKVAKFVGKATIASAKILWSLFLIGVALAFLAVDAYKRRREIAAEVKALVSVTKKKIRQRYLYLRGYGSALWVVKVLSPVSDRRNAIAQRLVLAKSALLE